MMEIGRSPTTKKKKPRAVCLCVSCLYRIIHSTDLLFADQHGEEKRKYKKQSRPTDHSVDITL